MSDVRVVPFRAEHLLDMHLREHDRRSVSAVPGGLKALAPLWKAGGPAFTLLDGERTLACAGVLLPRRGLGEAWAVTSPGVERAALSLHRAAKRGLTEIIESRGLCRVQATVSMKNKAAIRWAERLGFEKEAVMRSFVDEEAYVLYGKVNS